MPDLKLVQLHDDDPTSGHAQILARRGASLEITITDADGNELTVEPRATAARQFMCRATARVDRVALPHVPARPGLLDRVTRRMRADHSEFGVSAAAAEAMVDVELYLAVGVSDPVDRHDFLTRQSWRMSAEAEAVADLVRQLFPHPSKAGAP